MRRKGAPTSRMIDYYIHVETPLVLGLTGLEK